MFNDGLLSTIEAAINDLIASAIKVIPAILGALIILFLTRYAAQYLGRIVDAIVSKTVHNTSLELLAKRTTAITVWITGILIACLLVFPGLGLGDLIATLGLTSVAVGFAFQDIFKNFLAGILLLIQQPFRIGDQVIITDYEGTVEGIDIRTTQVRTYEGELVIIPNSTVFTNAVQVRTAYNTRRTNLGVGVDYNTPLAEAQQILERTINGVEGVLSDPPVEIDLVNFGDSSIDFVVRYWTKPQQKVFRQVQTRAVLAIKKAFDEADISIPYPIRTLYYYDQDKYNDYLPAGNGSTQDG
jgi:small conductance mechanosensitive channel